MGGSTVKSKFIKEYNKVYEGIHLYVNLNTLPEIIKREEMKRDNLNRVFHAVDNFISTLEVFINTYDDEVYVEKLTNSRTHIVFYKTEDIVSNFIEVVKFSIDLIERINNENKYQKLLDFKFSMGADFGYFTEFDFQPNGSIVELEYTSIGFPANRAAKLQTSAADGEILLSREVVKLLEFNRYFQFQSVKPEVFNRIKMKYPSLDAFSTSGFRNYPFEGKVTSSIERALVKYRTNINEKRFGDIDFSDTRKKIDFENLSLLNPKRVNAVVIYADIRGFTKKFDANGRNLLEMSNLTREALRTMYNSVIQRDATHLQFQGDRESALRNDFSDLDYVWDGLLCSMHIMEQFYLLTSKEQFKDLDIGIGCSYGTVFASKVGIRGHKHKLIMGKTATEADLAEDLGAQAKEIAITKEMYDYLINLKNGKYSKVMNKSFILRNGYYVTRETLTMFRQRIDNMNQEKASSEAKQNQAQRPWSNW